MVRAWMIVLVAVTLGTLAPADLRAQGLADYDYENLSFRGIGFGYGFIWPDKVDATTAYSMRLDLGFLGPAVRISPSIAYWSSTMKSGELTRLADRLSQLPPLLEREVVITAADLGTVRWSDLNMMIDAHVVWTAPFNILTYVGAGAGIHLMNGRGDAIDDTFIEDLLDSAGAGGALIAGFEYRIGTQIRFYGEGRYALASQVRYPGFRTGLALMLPPRSDLSDSRSTR
jgi:hypothetical protein